MKLVTNTICTWFPLRGSSINVNCDVFDSMVTKRKTASENMAREAMNMGESQSGQRKKVTKSSKDLLCEDHVEVALIPEKKIRCLWSISSKDLWVELTELRTCFWDVRFDYICICIFDPHVSYICMDIRIC